MHVPSGEYVRFFPPDSRSSDEKLRIIEEHAAERVAEMETDAFRRFDYDYRDGAGLSVTTRPSGCLALHFAKLEIADFEPPIGTERLRGFWDHHWREKLTDTRQSPQRSS